MILSNKSGSKVKYMYIASNPFLIEQIFSVFVFNKYFTLLFWKSENETCLWVDGKPRENGVNQHVLIVQLIMVKRKK